MRHGEKYSFHALKIQSAGGIKQIATGMDNTMAACADNDISSMHHAQALQIVNI
jgi:hypothetical protein